MNREGKPALRAFVLGGGGARGALQVGALRALFEAGLQPDLLVGTSVGAINATYLASRGCTVEALADLERAWQAAAGADLLPDNYVWITIRSLFGRGGAGLGPRLRDFFVSQGLDPKLCFGDLQGPRLIIVSANLQGCCTVLFGVDPADSVLDAVLASTAIPPWVRPWPHGDQLLVDGGLISNLPVETALHQGAGEIVALDVTDPRNAAPVSRGPGPFVFQLLSVIEQRQMEMEVQLAAARSVPVHHIQLRSEAPVQVWQFDQPETLFERGYAVTRQYLAEHPELVWEAVPGPGSRMRQLWDRIGELPLVARRPSLRALHRRAWPRQA